MLVLHLDDVPEDLYGRIAQLAVAEQVPLREETLRLLRQVVAMRRPAAQANITQLLATIRENPITPAAGTPDSVELLREDRSS